MFKYVTTIYWSQDDDCYVAEAPQLPGCMAHGDSYESALKNVKEAIQLWIDTAIESGDPVPVPNAYRSAHAQNYY